MSSTCLVAPRVRIDLATDAFLGIDIMPTFMPGGGLAVTEGDRIVPVVLDVMSNFPKRRRFGAKDRHKRGFICLASSFVGFAPKTMLTYEMVKDWAPDNHRIAKHALFTLDELKIYLSIVKFQILWDDHALEGTPEAEFHPLVSEDLFEYVQVKGMDPACDSYSAFFDNLHRPTGLAHVLRGYGVRRCIFTGLAFDYCVGWSALDAVEEGFEAIVVEDATRSVGYPPDSVSQMHTSLAAKNIRAVKSIDLIF